MNKLKQHIAAYARSLGFSRMGVTSAAPLEAAEKSLGSWLDGGCAGSMDYMEKNWRNRARPEAQLPGAKSVISLTAGYYSPSPTRPLPEIAGKGEGKVARYAWGKDYHKVIEKRLDALVRYMEALAPSVRCKTYIDTGPLLERALAQKAGLGFIGKNTMLIARGTGSWVFLASVLTTLELPEDAPDARHCGSCTLCIDACPTQALTEPYHLDARRCISYLTIESKEAAPEDLRSKTGEWIFGCDVCQDVCPHNTRVETALIPELTADSGTGRTINLREVLSIQNDADFDRRFAGTPVKRAKRHGLLKNACVTAAHQQRTDLLPQLETLASQDPHPAVREHARWATQRLSKNS
jgi:epoxyqueuosine reductase